MGENVLRGQVKNFRKGADRSLDKLVERTLFDRPDIVSTTFTAMPDDGQALSEGEQLDAHASADRQSIHLARANVLVARIEGDGAKTLLDHLIKPGSPGVLPMKIVSVSAISGYIKAVVAESSVSN
jgi:hypothetical protein